LYEEGGNTVVAEATQDNGSEEFCAKDVSDCSNIDCPAGSFLDRDDPECTCSQCGEGKFRHEHGDAFCSYCSAFDSHSVPNQARDGCVCYTAKGDFGFYGKIKPGTYRPGSLARLIDSNGHVADLSSWDGEGKLTVRGRLEVRQENGYYVNWGTVCNDNFMEKEATVACRQIAAAYGLKGGEVVQWELPNSLDGGNPNPNQGSDHQAIWLDDLNCNGNETRLIDCKHAGWGNHDCSHIEDQVIECTFEHDNSVIVQECIDCLSEPGWVAVQDGEESYCVEEGAHGTWIGATLISVPLIILAVVGIIMCCFSFKKAGCCCSRRRNNSVLAGRSNSIRGEAAFFNGGQGWMPNAPWSLRGGLTASVREMSWRNRGSTYWGGAGQEPDVVVIATPMHGNEPINAITTAHTQL
jgi:hypothetical protein